MTPMTDTELLRTAAHYHTPLYIFDEVTIRERCRELKGCLTYVKHKIRYACNLCESGDVFTADSHGTLIPRRFPTVKVGDLMVMSHVGAYSHPMKSEYNSMNLPASLMRSRDGRMVVVERRGTCSELQSSRSLLRVRMPATSERVWQAIQTVCGTTAV